MRTPPSGNATTFQGNVPLIAAGSQAPYALAASQ